MNYIHSFAICAYKKPLYLQECIDSLKNQTSKSDIILCTSTPSDFLVNIAKKNNIPVKINNKNEGIASDWNFALKQAKSKYVTLVHHDDIYLPNFTKETIDALEKDVDSLIAYTNYQDIVQKGKTNYIRNVSLNFLIKYSLNYVNFLGKRAIRSNKLRLLRFGSPIGCPSVTYNKANIKNFKFSSDFSINIDWDAWCKLSQRKGSFIWINKTLMSHRIHVDSETSHGLAQNRRQSEDNKMFALLWPRLIADILTKIYSISYFLNK